MSSYARKLRRLKEIKQAQSNSKLWTSDDWSYFRTERMKLLREGVPKRACSRRAYRATVEMIGREL